MSSINNSSSTADQALSRESWASFGNLSKAYVAGRSEHPKDALDLFRRYVGSKAAVLDLGSGTGLGTRQVVQSGIRNVTGIDSDTNMLAEARKDNSEGSIRYVQADVSKKIPFPSSYADAMTAFSSMHWFSDSGSIKEITRVLKPGGYLLIVKGLGDKSKEKDCPIKKQAKKIVEETLGYKLPKKDKDKEAILRDLMKGGLEIITDTNMPRKEDITPEKYLDFFKSHSFWNVVEKSPLVATIEEKVLGFLREVAKENKGVITREENTRVVLMKKPKAKAFDPNKIPTMTYIEHARKTRETAMGRM